MHIETGDVPWWGHTYDYSSDLVQAFPAGGNSAGIQHAGCNQRQRIERQPTAPYRS